MISIYLYSIYTTHIYPKSFFVPIVANSVLFQNLTVPVFLTRTFLKPGFLLHWTKHCRRPTAYNSELLFFAFCLNTYHIKKCCKLRWRSRCCLHLEQNYSILKKPSNSLSCSQDCVTETFFNHSNRAQNSTSYLFKMILVSSYFQIFGVVLLPAQGLGLWFRKVSLSSLTLGIFPAHYMLLGLIPLGICL